MIYADQIADILGAKPYGLPATHQALTHLSHDTRTLSLPQASLFFALQGPRQDGHQFITKAFQKGVRHFVVSKPIDPPAFPEATFFLVPETLRALQSLARWKRQQFDLPVIGITGSNAKTIIKEWLFQLLREDYDIVRSPRSYNSQIGAPLSVWQLQDHHQLALFEAGVSQTGEMQHLEPIIQCTLGLFTNIGEAHQLGFESIAQKIAEKALLFEHTPVIFCCRDHQVLYKQLKARFADRLFCWTTTAQAADLQFQLQEEEHHTIVHYQQESLSLPFTDRASVENALHCLAILIWFKIPFDQIRQRMTKLPRLEMRLELKPGIRQCQIVNDSYTFDLTALEVALDFVQKQGDYLNRTAILSDLAEGNTNQAASYQRLAQALIQRKIKRLFGIGQAIQMLQKYLPASVDQTYYPDTDTFLKALNRIPFRQEIILVKGARSFAFERIVHRLTQHSHSTRLEINLSALVHNLQVYTDLLHPNTKRMVMVKAAAYGSGSDEVSRLLEFHQVDYLGVAYTDEGIALREAGIHTPILVLNPEPATVDALVEYRLEPEVYAFHQLDQLPPYSSQLPLHLNLDTGMHRLGFMPKDIPRLMEWLSRHQQVQIASVFSHLAASESPEQEAFTRHQATLFQSMTNELLPKLPNRPLLHLLNSSGISRYPEYQFDMVRIGIGLYGADETQKDLQVVAALKSFVTQIKSVPAKVTIGYGRTGVRSTPGRIAVIGIGYADGLLRLAGQGRFQVLIRGQLAPTIGHICMDMCMVDVTHIPSVREGDEVIIFGQQPTIHNLAQALQTIPYEVLTNISERVRRVYVG